MKGRAPFGLLWPLRVYNLVLVLLNAYFFVHFARATRFGATTLACGRQHDPVAPFTLWMGWAFYVSKFVDFVDTLFFVARKKQGESPCRQLPSVLTHFYNRPRVGAACGASRADAAQLLARPQTHSVQTVVRVRATCQLGRARAHVRLLRPVHGARRPTSRRAPQASPDSAAGTAVCQRLPLITCSSTDHPDRRRRRSSGRAGLSVGVRRAAAAARGHAAAGRAHPGAVRRVLRQVVRGQGEDGLAWANC